jgi:DNA-binding GntR family transcriptional regulator
MKLDKINYIMENQFLPTTEETDVSRSLTESTYQQLRRDIISCKLVPGKRLNIKELSSSLGTNSAAVRESLSRLSTEELIIIEPQKGFRVASMSLDELIDLISVRIDLETNVLRRSIAAGDVNWEAQLIAAFHQLSRSASSSESDSRTPEWERLHSNFHEALMAGCTSLWLKRLRRLLYTQNARYRALSIVITHDERDLHGEHQALMEAAIARDGERAAEILTMHLQKTADAVVHAFRSDATLQAWFKPSHLK